MMDTPNLATRVFSITELLEHILLYLPQKDILAAQTISHPWSRTIKASSKLQRRLFLLPNPQKPQSPPADSSTTDNHITVTTFLGSIQIPHPLHTTPHQPAQINVNPLIPLIRGPSGHWRITAASFTPSPAFPSPSWLPIPDPLLYDIYRAQQPTLSFDSPVPSVAPDAPSAQDPQASQPGPQPISQRTPPSWRAMYVTQPPSTQVRLSLVHEHTVLSFRSKKMVHSAKAYRSRMLTASDGVKIGAIADAAAALLQEEWEQRGKAGPKMWLMREHVWIVEAVVASADTGPPCSCREREAWDGGGRGVFWRDAGDEEW